MIRNILFDMGNVLIHFDRRVFLDRLDICEEDKQLLLREVFLSVEWVQMDRGTLAEPEAEVLMCRRLPEHLHGAVHALVSEWDTPMLPVAGMAQLVEELKGKGYGIYLLSNASIRQHEYWPKIPGWQFFDGKVISADEKVMKPHPDYYRTALKRFGLKPEECFFIDDVPANIEGALYCGISGAVFHKDVTLLRRQLSSAGVDVSA
ncbi:MAG: HAD family phosphatase [Oscillospiraceae bacterium]|nr:HAD family phosphatase [Oscillospiraceae bacterium]